MAKQRITDEKFERQYEEATKRGEEAMKTEPRARSAHYDRKQRRIVVELMNGCTFMFPPTVVQGLETASADELSEVEVTPQGFGLHWEKLDADFTVAGLLAGIFGTKAWMSEMGRRGGTVRSEAKAAAVRENGRKGGRPRTKTA
jgi:hypothetical protein